MDLKEVLTADQVLIDIDERSKEAVITRLAEVLLYKEIILNQSEFVKSVLVREAHATTGIGQGIALPHGKSATVQKSAIAVARLQHGVEWHSLDDNPVELVFLLAIPEADKGDQHLKIISELAAKMLDDELMKQLKKTTNGAEIVSLLS